MWEIEVLWVLTLRDLLTLGPISLIPLTFFIAILSRPSLIRRDPWEVVVYNPDHILSLWPTLFSCTPLVSPLHLFSPNRRAGILGSTPTVCAQQEAGSLRAVWECRDCWPRTWGALQEPSPLFSPYSHRFGSSAGECVEDPADLG